MGILSTEKTLGEFDGVTDVDITMLTGCNVEIVAWAGPCVPVAKGRRWLVNAINAAFTCADAGVTLVISNNGNASNVRNTGRADAGPGGFANTGHCGPLSSRAKNITVRNTGDATATGGGYANSGISRHPVGPVRPQETIHTVRQGKPFKRDVGAAVTVTLTVSSGTEVKYLK